MKRRDPIEVAGLLGLCVCLALLGCERGDTRSTAPNIVILLADDLGWRDVGYHGSEFETPHIDALVAESVELDRFYTASWCTPTRSGIMTGRYPHRYGFPYTLELGKACILESGEQLLSEFLAEAGYRERALVGKWDLGGGRRAELRPRAQGFTRFYGFLGGMVDYFRHTSVPIGKSGRQGSLDWYRDDDLSQDTGYATDLLAREAASFIAAQRENSDPFFLFVAFNAPHLPLQARPEDLELLEGPAHGAPPLYLTEDRVANRQIARAVVQRLDAAIGEILVALDRAGLRDETFLWFLSDNGGQSTYGVSDNRPLRGDKNTLFEGGVRVPAAVRWPGMLPAGVVLEEPIAYIDLLPTLLRAASLDRVPSAIDGVDVLETLRSAGTPPAASSERAIYLGEGAVVTREWKLLGEHLYRIAKDPGEAHDLAAEHPEVVARLKAAARRAEAPLAAR